MLGSLKLVAEASAHGDLVASLGTPAAQHSCARLGLHPGQKPVGLRAMAAVWLEGTLRHLIPLLLNFLRIATVSQYTSKSLRVPRELQRKRVTRFASCASVGHQTFTSPASQIDLHKEWCNAIFIS